MFQIRRLQDAHLEDIDLIEQYYKYFFEEDIEKAEELINNNEQLKSKVLNKDNLNKIVTSINEIENWYDRDVTQDLSNKINSLQLSIDELIYLTDYNQEMQYEKFNFVYYNDEMYFCFETPPIGALPTDENYWIYLGLKGEHGSYGTGLNYKGNWSSNTSYNKNDMVVYQKTIYVARKSSNNQIPVTVSDYWMPLLNVSDKGIYVSFSGSQYTTLGDLWIEILGWGYSSSKKSQNIKIGEQSENFNIGDFWFEMELNFNKNSGIFISSEEPTYSLNNGDIWIEIPNWLLNEQNLKGIYIAKAEPDNIKEGQIWIELLYN